MPSAETILTGLTAIANEWRWLALLWHLLLGALLVTLLAGWRPSSRVMGYLLVAPLLSVSLLAWVSGNPFNGTVFAILSATLAGAATRIPNSPVQVGSPAWIVPRAVLNVYGWTYPHFLRSDSWATYLFASPLGIVPCPTLSVVTGLTLVFRTVRSSTWSTTLVVAGLLYGAVGVFRLDVQLDWGLLFGAATLAAAWMRDDPDTRSVRADHAERTQTLPGDDLIHQPLGTLTHAVTVDRSPQAVWPWLVQMGAGARAGWYSYDALDNGRRPSATRLVPALQNIGIGTVFPALPGVTEGFVVLAFEPYRWLILGWPSPDGSPQVTWAFVLKAAAGNSTRLIVRARAGRGYRFHGLPSWLSLPIVRLAHFVMQRKQLLGIARRAASR